MATALNSEQSTWLDGVLAVEPSDAPTQPIKPFAARSADAGEATHEQRAALVEALARTSLHDAAALLAVYRMTHAKLEAVCLTVCLDYQDAQEALQDCYIAVWRNAARFDATRASPITWLVRIARNKAIDRLRKRKTEPPHSVSDAELDVPDTAPNPEEAMLSGQRQAIADAGIASLAHAQRALVRAIYVEGLTYTQLSARSGLPIATVKSSVRRAVTGLRALLIDRTNSLPK